MPRQQIPAKQETVRTASGKTVEKVVISMTDTRPFRRLVNFVDQVTDYAEETGDEGLQEILDELASDLLEALE